ncbi:hypothetical protein [Virgisporangium aurantiacum]|uniref:MFS transporter n=1 Tax=Virgisporangium aurantiacum TaxID=175570 RepID=A0A8J3ZET1_9ACTN|nr:hypothetical protein [Virgisporangium aurantiacum]GIJ61473.1 MFS transporter [Virgisporangium aurantiacum]
MRVDVRVVAYAVVLAGGYLLLPTVGTDLAAQVARADFIRDAGFAPVDLRWYGGTVQYGYSIVAPAVMALLGVRVTGALALVVSTVAFAVLLRRTGAIRPRLGMALGGLCFAGNLVSGRTTFALGVAFGLLGLLALTAPWRVGWRWGCAATAVVLAATTSPVAGLFAGLAGVALAAGCWRDAARRWDGVVLAGSAAVGLVPTTLLSDVDGWMNLAATDTVRACVTGLLVAALVPRRPVRVGGLLAAAGVLAAFLVHTPVGLNATRLATMFAVPVLAAYVPLPRPGLGSRFAGAAGLAVVAVWQPPLIVADLRDAGNPTADRAYFAPLLAELRSRRPVGRVEIPPTRDYWEAAYAARDVHLARGWLRQADLARNPLFFTGALSASDYEAWLREQGVSYVALPTIDAADFSWVGRREAALVRGGLPYLTEVWRGDDWTLYEVDGRPSIVDGGTLVATDAGSVTVDVPAGSTVVKIRYSGWLRVDDARNARLEPGPAGWTRLVATVPGRYRIDS